MIIYIYIYFFFTFYGFILIIDFFFKVNKVTTKHEETSKMSPNCIKGSIFAPMPKQNLGRRLSNLEFGNTPNINPLLTDQIYVGLFYNVIYCLHIINRPGAQPSATCILNKALPTLDGCDKF